MEFVKLENFGIKYIENPYENEIKFVRNDDQYFVVCNGKVAQPFDRVAVESENEGGKITIKGVIGRKVRSYRVDVHGNLKYKDTEYCLDSDYYEPTFFYAHLLKQGYSIIEANQEFTVFKNPKGFYVLVPYTEKAENIADYPKYKSYIELALCNQNKYAIGYFDVGEHYDKKFNNITRVYDYFAGKINNHGDLFSSIVERDRALSRNTNMKDIIDKFYFAQLKLLYLLKKAIKEGTDKTIYDNSVNLKISDCLLINKKDFVDNVGREFETRRRPNGYVTYKGLMPLNQAMFEIVTFMVRKMGRVASCFEFNGHEKYYIDWMNFDIYSDTQLMRNGVVTYIKETQFLDDYKFLIQDALKREKLASNDRSDFKKMSLRKLNIDEDIVRLLQFNDIYFVGDLLKYSEYDLFLKGLTIRQVNQIIGGLSLWDLELKQKQNVLLNSNK